MPFEFDDEQSRFELEEDDRFVVEKPKGLIVKRLEEVKPIVSKAGEVVESAVGGAEAAAQFATGIPSFFTTNIPAGLAGLAKGMREGWKRMRVGDLEHPISGVEDDKRSLDQVMTEEIGRVQSTLTPYFVYEPKTARGKQSSEFLQKAIDFFITTPAEELGEATQDVTGSAALAAGANVTAELLGYTLAFKGAKVGGSKLQNKFTAKGFNKLSPNEKLAFERSMIEVAEQLKKEEALKPYLQYIERNKQLGQKALPFEGTSGEPALPVTPGGKVVPSEIATPLSTIRKPGVPPVETKVFEKIGERVIERGVKKGELPVATEIGAKPSVKAPIEADRLKLAMEKEPWARDASDINLIRAAAQKDTRFVDENGRPIESASLVQKLSDAVGKSDEPVVLKKLGIIGEKAQIEAIVDDAVKQKADTAAALRKNGKPTAVAMAEKLEQEAKANGKKLIDGSGENAVVRKFVEDAERSILAPARIEDVLTKQPLFKNTEVLNKIVETHNSNSGSSITQTGADLYGKPGWYSVALKGYEKILDKAVITAEDLQKYVAENKKVLQEHPDAFVGSWVDEGKTYLDISRAVRSREVALKLAESSEQKAIFDLGKGESIYLKDELKLPEDVKQAVNNASGESAASMEAISRDKTTKFYAVNEKTGAVRPLIGVDAVDVSVKPTEIKVGLTGGKVTVLDRGAKTTGRLDDILADRILRNQHGAINLEGLKEAWPHIKEAWQEFWTPFSTLPQHEKLEFLRSKHQGDVGRAEATAVHAADKLKKFDLEVRKDFFRYQDGQISLEALPKDARPLALEVQRLNNRIGKALVDRGLISKETFEEHKGHYAAYIIGKHAVGADGLIGLAPSGKMDLGVTKARNPNLTYEQRLELGLIEDAGVSVPLGVGKSLVDIAKSDYLAAIAKNPEWTWQPGFIDVNGQRMSIGKLFKERSKYEEMVKAFPDNAQIKARLVELQAASEGAAKQTGNVPAGYVQLPDVSGYGELAGAFVRKPIADDIMPLWSSTLAQNKSEMFKTVMQIETESVALFKIGKVAINIPTVVRNIISNFGQNNMRGRALTSIPGDVVRAGKSMLNNDAFHREAKRYGLFKTNWAVEEINSVINEFAKVEPGKWHTFLGAVKNVAKYYGRIDDIAKHSIYVQLRSEGMPIDVALREAQKWGMDYSLAPRSVKELRRHLIPFVSYQYKAAPLIYESLTKRPWVIGKYLAIPYAMSQVVQELNDIDQKEWDRMIHELPDEIRRKKSYMVMPWKDPEGRWQWVNLEYFFPWGNWLSISRDLREGEATEAYRDSGIGNNPLIDLHVAWKTARRGEPPKDPYTGQPIYDRLDDPQTQWLKLAEFLYRKWGPEMLTRTGAAGTTYRYVMEQEDKWGRTPTFGQSLGRWFGANIVAVEPRQATASRKARVRVLKEELVRKLRDRTLTDEQRDAARRRYLDELRKINGIEE